MVWGEGFQNLFTFKSTQYTNIKPHAYHPSKSHILALNFSSVELRTYEGFQNLFPWLRDGKLSIDISLHCSSISEAEDSCYPTIPPLFLVLIVHSFLRQRNLCPLHERTSPVIQQDILLSSH